MEENTKNQHVKDQSSVLSCIMIRLYKGEVVDLRELAEEFEYRNTSMYRLISKIRANISINDPDNHLVHISKHKYKLFKNNSETY